MRAITVMYDSLNRGYLPCYGDTVTIAPNFARLAERTVVFDNFHVGSLPCIPARRELHTGRYNFLHRSWGPLEPFDDSAPALLGENGVYTHCVTDHAHYWQEGGATYLTKYSSCEMIRGQEGDLWRGKVDGFTRNLDLPRQDKVNREHMREERDHPHAQTFAAAMRFLEDNADADNWHLHVEYFDPHEPYFVPEKYKDMYADGAGGDFDWPFYGPVEKGSPEVAEARRNYRALVSMCDQYLGRLLDFMDAHGMWKDTMLIVCTDHGFLLGEHGYFAKNYMPCYDELVRTPFFLWDPRIGKAGERRAQLAQTIDIAPTLLDFFDLEQSEHMRGKALAPVAADGQSIHERLLFGYFGKHVNITDGRYVYMRSGRTADDALFNYTVLPLHIFTPFTLAELRLADRRLVDGFAFAKGVPLMKIPASGATSPQNSCYQYEKHMQYGDLLFDLHSDPGQAGPLDDPALARRMLSAMREMLEENEAPPELYRRIGL